jgi:hypothetical protein
VIVGAEAFFRTGITLLSCRGQSIVRLSVDLDVDPPVDQYAVRLKQNPSLIALQPVTNVSSNGRHHVLSCNAHRAAPRINDVVWERRGISADTAMRLLDYFGGLNFELGAARAVARTKSKRHPKVPLLCRAV